MLVLGGGIGNMIDRIFRGYVVDMFDLQFMDYPIFNLADIFVVAGVILGAVYYLWFYDKYDAQREGERAMTLELTKTEDAGVRLDAFLSADGQLSRSQAARLIEEGRVAVDGRPAAKSCRVAEGQQVTVDIPEVKDTAVLKPRTFRWTWCMRTGT